MAGYRYGNNMWSLFVKVLSRSICLHKAIKFGTLTQQTCLITLLEIGDQNIWNKTVKSSKTGEDKKSLISIFACFLTAIHKVKLLERRFG